MNNTAEPIPIRPATDADRESIWALLRPVFEEGETYPIPKDTSKEDCLKYWFADGNDVFVAIDDDGMPVGTYYLKKNQGGGGAHIANCGYVTATWATGKGIARRMCSHSMTTAKAQGYRAMQFNFVISTNERAVKLWQSQGFEIVGTIPEGFLHPKAGYVDAYIMHKHLA